MDCHTESKCFVFENAYSLGTKLNDFRASGELCDVILKSENENFKAHKVVLSAASDMFKVMFSGGFKESSDNGIVVLDFSFLSDKTILMIVDFIYLGTLPLQKVIKKIEPLMKPRYFEFILYNLNFVSMLPKFCILSSNFIQIWIFCFACWSVSV